MSDITEQIEFLQAISAAENERTAAYETREQDKARWAEAKQNYAELRTFYRSLHAQKNMPDEGSVVRPAATSSEVATNGKGNN